MLPHLSACTTVIGPLCWSAAAGIECGVIWSLASVGFRWHRVPLGTVDGDGQHGSWANCPGSWACTGRHEVLVGVQSGSWACHLFLDLCWESRAECPCLHPMCLVCPREVSNRYQMDEPSYWQDET